jgi:hypothetical protein
MRRALAGGSEVLRAFMPFTRQQFDLKFRAGVERFSEFELNR